METLWKGKRRRDDTSHDFFYTFDEGGGIGNDDTKRGQTVLFVGDGGRDEDDFTDCKWMIV